MWMIVFVSDRNLGTPLVACLVRVIGEEVYVLMDLRFRWTAVSAVLQKYLQFYKNSDA
jgi:hypothetical protein